MATVRMTKDLKSAIISKLQGQFQVRREALRKHIAAGFEPLKAQYFEDLLTTVLEQHGMPRDIYDAIPDGWCHRVNELGTNRINNVPTHEVLPNGSCIGGAIKIPAALEYGRTSMSLDHPRLQPYAEYAAQANEQLRQLSQEEHSAVHEANRLLGQCGSLKQALDVWPHLIELLPERAIEQHKQVAEKRKKAGPIAIDADRLTGALVAGKMATAVLNRLS